jgi:hypothetical protein
MDLTAFRIHEPVLIFGNGGRHVDPKAGLALFGPSGHAKGGQGPTSIVVGLVGPQEAIESARAWLETLNSPVACDNDNPRLFPPFPGFRATLGSTIAVPENLMYDFPPKRLSSALGVAAHKNRVNACAALYAEGLEVLGGKAGRPNLVVYAWSEEIQEKCAGKGNSARLSGQEGRFRRKLMAQESGGQTRLAPLDEDAERLLYTGKSSWNLHAQMKVDAMRVGVPIQILEPRTYRGLSEKSDPSTPWNLSTALYYKAGGIPWRPSDPDPNTCYIGIEFFRDKTATDHRMRTCVAQVFSDGGEGLVLRGGQFEHQGGPRQSPRMDRATTEKLLQEAISLFKKHNRQPPRRVVVHKSSHFVRAELEGAESALSEVEAFDLLTIIKHPGLQFLRQGSQPPVRGTMVILNEDQFAIYTHGYVPYLAVYPGLRVPRPLVVIRHGGTNGPQKLAGEIMKLTKLNWNAARFSSQMPSTLMYADLVKEVLAQVPQGQVEISEAYSSYM